jgi:tryptophanase
MAEIASGLIMQVDEGVVARYLLQVAELAEFLRQRYKLPVLNGCHVMYVGADHLLPNVPREECTAETFTGLVLGAFRLRVLGLGFAMKLHEKELPADGKRPIEPVKCALPRNAYSTEFLMGLWSLVGEAHERGIFKEVKRGVKPAPNREESGLYTQKFIPFDEAEFSATIDKL